MKPACPRPCAECPWRIANQGKNHPLGYHDPIKARALWSGSVERLPDGKVVSYGKRFIGRDTTNTGMGLRFGEVFECHGTFSAVEVIQCAGAEALQHRELLRFVEQGLGFEVRPPYLKFVDDVGRLTEKGLRRVACRLGIAGKLPRLAEIKALDWSQLVEAVHPAVTDLNIQHVQCNPPTEREIARWAR